MLFGRRSIPCVRVLKINRLWWLGSMRTQWMDENCVPKEGFRTKLEGKKVQTDQQPMSRCSTGKFKDCGRVTTWETLAADGTLKCVEHCSFNLFIIFYRSKLTTSYTTSVRTFVFSQRKKCKQNSHSNKLHLNGRHKYSWKIQFRIPITGGGLFNFL